MTPVVPSKRRGGKMRGACRKLVARESKLSLRALRVNVMEARRRGVSAQRSSVTILRDQSARARVGSSSIAVSQ
jgi:hypothetical protein